MVKSTTERVGVVGCGLTGAGIAETCARPRRTMAAALISIKPWLGASRVMTLPSAFAVWRKPCRRPKGQSCW